MHATRTHTVILALGANQGERRANLEAALQAMPPPVRPVEQSPIYQTRPWGYTDQPDFLNQVIVAETELDPGELLAYLKQIEAQLGRRPSFRYGPRMIDIDILFYDDLVMESPSLTIPHPSLADRAFVLVPLADLAPDLRHPLTGRLVHEILAKVDASGVKRLD